MAGSPEDDRIVNRSFAGVPIEAVTAAPTVAQGGVSMSVMTTERLPGIGTSEVDPFELDITFIEHNPAASALMIPTTDDNCGSTCPNACTTSAI
jgi:FxLD family lantipeptide